MPSAMVAHTVRFAVARGVPWARITAETGIEPRDLVRAETWLPGSVVPLTWRLVAELCPGEAPALDLARAAPVSFLGEVVPNMRFGRSLRQVIDFAAQFSGLTSDGLTIRVIEDDVEVALCFAHVSDVLDRGYGAEAGLGVGWRMLMGWLGAVDMLRVEFTHPPNGPEARYVDFFRVPVRFERPWNAMIFATELLDRPFTDHDPMLMGYVREHMAAMRAQLRARGPADALAAVRRAIEQLAERSAYSAEALARRMGMSLRSLQRHVRGHGSTVSALLDTARQANAVALLNDPRLSIDQVAEAVGYADRRAFNRAFKRWTGQTPVVHRKSRAESR